MKADVGIVGLGIMGSAMAKNLLAAGHSVAGYDPDGSAVSAHRAAGGIAQASAGEVASAAPVILLSLPSSAALEAVVADIARSGATDCVLVELSTLKIDDKRAARDALAQRDITLLDCPVSGTGAQAARGDLVVLASGDAEAVGRCRPFLDAIARETRYLGEFGNGMKMKCVANLLVAIHNTAAAEALVLAQRAGLDLQETYDVISAGAGSSRMFELRGPMMVEGRYSPPTMKNEVWRKDLDLIAEFAAGLGSPAPLFSLTDRLYAEAEAMGLGGEDTAAVKRVLDELL
ncbi:NAD(P)-dependent oxidoreductase [Hoeflea poritis]|uniref:NAD(P)-dependent oxidoreductase n=1 Tax=Hoeflea poritis TaxID=2993659 RepID=A0ABT4VKS3_9HYPH|nr:NAD(P)-dependent oxidoreductase [Hoeflea poritis]MDA4845276.1 NAD(P)-dependent oxidoreductase [Hoeflea poritis]